MKHLARSARPRLTRSLAGVAIVLALAPALLTGAIGASTDASAAVTDGTPRTVKGTGDFASVEVTVGNTVDLINQSVTVSWTGASPTVATASGLVLGNAMQLMQCWAEPGQQPTREQCQFGGFVDVPNATGNMASRQMTQSVIDPNETVYSRPPGDVTLRYAHFLSIDGTEEIQRRSQFFDAASTNEIPIAATASDGTGATLFEMHTGLEAPGLGCGQVINGRAPDCFIVVVPRNLTEVTGVTVGANTSDALTTSPLSTTNWANRIIVPLQFRAVGGSCTLGRPETPTIGSDYVTEAITSWQPVLCGTGDRNFGYTSLSDDTARNILASDAPDLVFISRTAAVPGAVYAPVTVSGLAIAADVEVAMPIFGPNGKPVDASLIPDAVRAKVGSRITDIKLTPRLVAKLLTQSYQFDVAFGTATNVANNPLDPTTDPDFLALNPDFRPGGYIPIYGNSFGRMLVTSGLSDSADLLWRYVLADPEAKAFLAGTPDQWGMVINERYRDLTLPINTFPRADLGCVIPSNVPPLFDLANCTLDVYPYTSSFASAARQLSRGEINRRDVAKQGLVNSYGLSANQLIGERAMLGLTDTASAQRYNQVTVALRNKAGAFVTPSTVSMSAAVAVMTKDEGGLLQPNLESASALAYPLTVVTYAATVPALLTANQRSDYARLLSYAAAEGQVSGSTTGTLPAGYVPLPTSLRSQTALVAAQIESYVAPTPTPTATSTPTSAPTASSTASPSATAPSSAPTEVDASTSGGSVGGPPVIGGDPPPVGPAPSPSAAAPTSSPTVVAVAASRPTPSDPVTAARLAVGAALVLGSVALLARFVLPWVAPRPPG